jgi:RNA polymerase sigma-70 factor (ECF subfamily)
MPLNKPTLRQTQVIVWRKGATLAELEELYRDRYEHFARVATGIAGNPECGGDAVQAAFVTAVRKRASFRGGGPLEAWLWRIVVNEASRLRRAPTAAVLDDAALPAANGHSPEEPELREWIACLPERQRAALFLRYYADLDYRAIAEMLGIEVGTVSATLSAAHKSLRRSFQEVDR